MLQIKELKLPFDHTEDDLQRAVLNALGATTAQVISFHICTQSVDARKHNMLCFVYMIEVEVRDEDRILAGRTRATAAKRFDLPYEYHRNTRALPQRPVVVGSGPAGLFSGLLLARAGCRPIILERGKRVEERVLDVARFIETGLLNPESNVQFGEGGAGTFSDGKLTTLIHDHRCHQVLLEMVAAGAPPEILYKGKPHIGTDRLRTVVVALRKTVEALGGEFRFLSKCTGLTASGNAVTAVRVNDSCLIETDTVVLAIGNGARDTFKFLYKNGLTMTAKPFSIGVRIEHPRTLVDHALYGKFAADPRLGAASYKLAHHGSTGRSVYTFCMCPGGFVVAAASEQGGVVTNGMSEFARNRPNSNSALMVGVGPEEFGSDHPLAGVAFQRHWESMAFGAGGGNYFAPVQRVEDFLRNRPSKRLGEIAPSYRPGVTPTDLRACLPDYVCSALKEAIPAFDRKLKGFALPDAVLTAIETRSSSPVRIVRDKLYQTTLRGVYSCGEGAGYAGGIMSAAVDGIRTAEAILKIG